MLGPQTPNLLPRDCIDILSHLLESQPVFVPETGTVEFDIDLGSDTGVVRWNLSDGTVRCPITTLTFQSWAYVADRLQGAIYHNRTAEHAMSILHQNGWPHVSLFDPAEEADSQDSPYTFVVSTWWSNVSRKPDGVYPCQSRTWAENLTRALAPLSGRVTLDCLNLAGPLDDFEESQVERIDVPNPDTSLAEREMVNESLFGAW